MGFARESEYVLEVEVLEFIVVVVRIMTRLFSGLDKYGFKFLSYELAFG